MRRTFLVIVALASLVLTLAVCNVSGPDTGEDGKWPCESDEDCPDSDQSCRKQDGEKVCTSELTCADGDEDGYGSETSLKENDGDGLSTCQACVDGEPKACEEADCDDGDGDIHPGAPELCDGLDNDCDEDEDGGGIDEMECTPESEGGEGCPFDVSATPETTQIWSCEEVDGSHQCVLEGANNASTECDDYKSENSEEETWGICGADEPEEWSEIPEPCR